MPKTNVCIDCATKNRRKMPLAKEETKYPYIHSIDQIAAEWFYIITEGVEPEWGTSSLTRNEEEERMINYLSDKENMEEEIDEPLAKVLNCHSE